MFMTTKRHLAILAAERNTYARGMEAEQAASKAKDNAGELLATYLANARAALTEIAAMETPVCAPIGKRMAAVARGALPA